MKIAHKNRILQATLMVCGLFIFNQAWSFTEPCQLVAKMAGKGYESAPLKIASLTAPANMPESYGLKLIEQNGGWFIYQSENSWFEKDTCAALKKTQGNQLIAFSPVLLNKSTGNNAVVTPSFMIKTYNKEDLQAIAGRYGFELLTLLPSGGAAIFSVTGVSSYDRMLEELDRDKDVQFAVPLLSEPRYKTR